MLEETVELSHGGIMQSFLRFGLRFEADETFLELRNPLYRASRNHALTLQRPCFINHVASVFSESGFQFRALRFGVAGNISVQRTQCSIFTANCLLDVGMILIGCDSQ